MNRQFAIIISAATALLVGLLIALSIFRSGPQSSETSTPAEVAIPTLSPNNRNFTGSSSNARSNNDIKLNSTDTSAIESTVKKLPIDSAELKVEYSELLDTFYIQNTATDAAQLNQFLEENNLLNLYKSHPKFFKFTNQNPKDVMNEDEGEFIFINENGIEEFTQSPQTNLSNQQKQLEVAKGLFGIMFDYSTPTPTPTSVPTTQTTISETSIPVGNFQNGFPVTPADTTKIPCPVSPTVSDIGVRRIYANGVGFYNIRLCKVHGFSINSVKAKDFDGMYTSMKSSGYIYGGGSFRTQENQIAMHQKNPNGSAPGGSSNHERGLAVDTTCSNKDGTAAYKPWMSGKARGLKAFAKAIAEHPCLRWIHNNSSRYGLLLMCDGKGKYGEIAVKTGGCETWHLSPTGH